MRVPGNPAPLVKDSLVAYLSSDATVVRDVPDTYKPKSGKLVLVADDSGPMKWPIMSKNIVRVTVFGDGMTSVRALANRCYGHLLEDRPDGLSRIWSDGTILEARDPKTGADLASFIVTATIRTATI